MSETNYYQKNRDIILKKAKEYYRNNPLTEEQKKRISDYQKEYRKNMTDEQKQKAKDHKKEYRKNMTDEQKLKIRDYQKHYQKEYRKNMTDDQKKNIEKLEYTNIIT